MAQSSPIIERPQPMERVQPGRVTAPPLNTGDRLSRAEFEKRYEAHPEIRKAELIEGVVYVMASPIHHKRHGEPHGLIATWVGVYILGTFGVVSSIEPTIRLDFENEVQPDILLLLEPTHGGRARYTEDDYIEGPPELIVEIAASSVAYDMHGKRRIYARNGVGEYLVVQMYEQKIDWFVLREGGYEALAPDEKGILRSEVFPGLWLHTQAFWANDRQAMFTTLREGLASEEHATFVARLQEQARLKASP